MSCCSRTIANELSHSSGNISKRKGVMESYCLLQRYFYKAHNVTIDVVRTNIETERELVLEIRISTKREKDVLTRIILRQRGN